MDSQQRQTFESHLGSMLESVGVGQWEYDHQFDQLRRSPALLRILGMGEDEAIVSLKVWLDTIHREDLPITMERFQAALSGREGALSIDYRLIGPDGRWRWISVRGIALRRDASGQPLFSAGITFDVTDRRAAEEALREHGIIHSAIVGQAVDGIDLIDLETLHFVEVNQAACTMLGYSRDEFATLTLPDIQATFDRPQLLQSLDVLRDQGPTTFENRLRRKDGTSFDVRISAQIIRLHGRDHLVEVWHDISARKQSDTQLKAQISELQRWHEATLGRELRILELKREVNELLQAQGQPPRYASAEAEEPVRSPHPGP
jgi:two-component system, sensor histidine kinase and response regulator